MNDVSSPLAPDRNSMEPDDHPSVVTDPNDGPYGSRAEPTPTPSLKAGVANIPTRARGVHPTATAPIKADTFRHHSKEMPI